MFIKGMIKDCYLAKQPKITDNTYNVSITGDTDDLILYTMDGTDPIINGKVYNAPFKVGNDCIVEARAVNEWSYSSSAFADVKKSKSEIKQLTMRYQDMRLKGQSSNIYQSPFYYQYEDGRDEWTLFLCISHCISLNANIYTATYTTASGNTEGFKISVKNSDLYFDVYREGVVDESIVLSSGFGIGDNWNIESPVKIEYLIINSNGQINGVQRFKQIVANGKPTFPLGLYANVGDTDLIFGLADYCIYSGIKEELEGFYITEENVGKVEFLINDDYPSVQMRARGNIYYLTSTSGVINSDYVPAMYSRLYTANELMDGNNWTDKWSIRDYIATAYCGDGSTPVINSTTEKICPPAKCIKKNLDSSNLTGDLNVYTFNNGGSILLFYHNFVPTEYNQEVSLCKVLNGNQEQKFDVVLIPGVGFKVGDGQFQSYDTVEPTDFLLAISSTYISVTCNSMSTTSGSPYNLMNAIIQVNAPTVSLASDWAITHIVVSDSLDVLSIDKELIDYLPYEES